MSIRATDNQTTLILFGASNLTLAWPQIARQLNGRLQTPATVITAQGMGRSYLNERSRFAVRELPGILSCGVWQYLPQHVPDGRAMALLTDFGNDLIYGREPREVADSAAETIRRLREWCADIRIVVTQPPVDSVRRLTPMRFRFFRRVLFPSARMSLQQAVDATEFLNEQLHSVAVDNGASVFRPQPDWFGFDPIHITKRHRSAAFGRMLETLELAACSQSGTRLPRIPTSRPTPEVRWVLGKRQVTPQPGFQQDDVTLAAF